MIFAPRNILRVLVFRTWRPLQLGFQIDLQRLSFHRIIHRIFDGSRPLRNFFGKESTQKYNQPGKDGCDNRKNQVVYEIRFTLLGIGDGLDNLFEVIMELVEPSD